MIHQLILAALVPSMVSHLVNASGRHSVELTRKKFLEERQLDSPRRTDAGSETVGETTMSMYDIIGDDEDLLSLIAGLGTSEIVGDDDLFGAIGASLIGAEGNQNATKNAAKKAAIKKIVERGAGAVIQKKLRERRRFPIGFAVTDIAANANAVVPSLPQNLFRGERTLIPSDIAFDLGILDIKVGNQSQFVQSSEVPAAAYTEVAIDTEMHYDTAEVGNQLSISIRNKTGAEVEFTAAVLGTIAKP